MRPIELHLAGFTTFRHPTDVDFTGADLFVLSGPTGSGKSSIIDAICFALYGSIPRLNGVAPVISLGKNEARIRLRFEVEGELYTVSRLVARQGEGASQRDVRLEGGGAIVEGVREVDARIEKLLGLGFDHFTRTVVLPQGRFAAFLEDTPSGREKLLKQLLDLGVYEEMRKRAAARASRLEADLANLGTQLHELLVTDTDLTRAEGSVEGLRRLTEHAAAALDRLEAATDTLGEASRRREVVVEELARLEKVSAPDGVSRIAQELAEARAAAASAASSLTAAESSLTAARTRREELGEVAAVRTLIDAHGRLGDLRERLAEGERALAAATEAMQQADQQEEQARVAREEAAARLTSQERSHAAHALRDGLGAGDRCPVCAQVIDDLPSDSVPDDLEQARKAKAAAEAALAAAAERRTAAAAEKASVESRLAERRAAVEELTSVVADAPAPKELEATLRAIEEADVAIAEARRRVDAARQSATEAERRLARAAQAGAAASTELDRARDLVAGMEPPVPTREDPAADWEAMIDWRASATTVRSAERQRLDEAIETLEAERRAVRADLASEAAAVGVEELGDDPKVAVATALARAEANLERVRRELDKRAALEKRQTDLAADKATYDEMARLLRSNNFQQWLIEEALVGLVDFANTELAKLAGGAYSLAVDGGDFEVIDHRNAEARRSVKTLSGGETFLVSLALALALAERVVASSAVGTARLESMFLDEGFGTLDAETLDTVAAVVQELGSRERMVGLVTHVRELADQIPVRFEVRKLPGTSTVTRVDA